MTFYFKCPHCEHKMICEEQNSGTIRECPQCQTPSTIVRPLIQLDKPLCRDNLPKMSVNFKIADKIITDCSKTELVDALHRKLKQYSNKVKLYEDVIYAKDAFQSFFSIKYVDVIIEVVEAHDGYFLNAKVRHRPLIFFWVWLFILLFTKYYWTLIIALYYYQKWRTKEDIRGIFSHVKNRLSTISKPPQLNQPVSEDFSSLEKLAELRDKGIVTEEEFEAKKKQILGL